MELKKKDDKKVCTRITAKNINQKSVRPKLVALGNGTNSISVALYTCTSAGTWQNDALDRIEYMGSGKGHGLCGHVCAGVKHRASRYQRTNHNAYSLLY